MKVKSLRDLHKFKLGPAVQIQRAGSHYKARYAGRANFVFGESPSVAMERLLQSPVKLLDNSTRNTHYRERNWATGFREGRA